MIARLLLPFFMMLLFACGSVHNTPPPLKDNGKKETSKVDSLRKGVKFPKEMTITRKTAYDSFFVRIDDSIYFCTYKGKVFSADTNRKINGFILNIGAEYLIDEIYFHPLEDNRFFVAWQETDHEGVNSYFAVYSRGSSKADWEKLFRLPSPGQPAIHDDAVYISTLGMVGKYHLSSGTAYWLYDSLFDPLKLSYKRFEPPLIYNSTVCFYDLPIRGKKSKSDSIWVDDRSGKLIR